MNLINIKSSIDPENYAALSEDNVTNITLAPLVDRTLLAQQNATAVLELPACVQEVRAI